MKKDELITILNGDLAHIYNLDMYEDSDPTIRIVVYPKHVKALLELYLSKKITANELTLWANFICIRGEYVCENSSSDESADYYEDMFYVIQKLSTPEIDGEITPDTVKVYLTELDKYFTNDNRY